jgi:hypothetical protein
MPAGLSAPMAVTQDPASLDACDTSTRHLRLVQYRRTVDRRCARNTFRACPDTHCVPGSTGRKPDLNSGNRAWDTSARWNTSCTTGCVFGEKECFSTVVLNDAPELERIQMQIHRTIYTHAFTRPNLRCLK